MDKRHNDAPDKIGYGSYSFVDSRLDFNSVIKKNVKRRCVVK
jgi:hypothetical protein